MRADGGRRERFRATSVSQLKRQIHCSALESAVKGDFPKDNVLYWLKGTTPAKQTQGITMTEDAFYREPTQRLHGLQSGFVTIERSNHD